MKQQLKSVVAITAICAVVAILMAVTNYITAPIIKENENSAANDSLKVVMPSGEGFEAVDISKYKLPDTITEAYKENGGGYVFKITTSGYSSGLIIMCGVDSEGIVTGATCIASSETLGYETTYGEKFKAAMLDTIDTVDTISGATKTTEGYKNAVKDALNAFVIIGGGSVDLRSEDEILADNLKSALPSGDGKFTEWFMTESLEGVSAVYTADNGEGNVYLIGESFVGVDKDGNVVSEFPEDIKNTALTAQALVKASVVEEIDISGYDMPTQIVKAYKTASGNYVFDLKGAGFGINGDSYYNPSGEYIYIKASLTADGKVIDCKTVSQKETENFGAKCEEPSFYKQFVGKDETNYKEIDAISGATLTSNGYKTAISKAFEAVKILKGEA